MIKVQCDTADGRRGQASRCGAKEGIVYRMDVVESGETAAIRQCGRRSDGERAGEVEGSFKEWMWSLITVGVDGVVRHSGLAQLALLASGRRRRLTRRRKGREVQAREQARTGQE